jgi:hypothetical protein
MTNSLRVRLTDSQRKKLRDLLVGRYETMSEYRRRSLRVFFLTAYCLAHALSVYSQTAAPSTAST